MDHLRTTLRRYLADEPYRRLTDDELWARFRDHREEGAFRVFLEKTGGRIYTRCRAVLRVEADAEEAFQEAYGALFKHRSKLPTYRAAVAWLYQTATNAARMQRRRQWRSLLRDRRKAATSPADTEAGENLAQREQREAVAAALAELPQRERRAVELVYLEGMTHSEAADALGWSRGTLGTYVQRGLERLRQAPGLREGMTGAVLTAALADVRALPPVRLAELSECIWAKAGTATGLVGGWWPASRPRLVGGLTVGAGLAAVGGLTAWPRPAPVAPPSEAVETRAAKPETLQDRNLRIVTAEIVAPLRDIVQAFYPPDNPVRVAGVRAFGSEVEVEFRPTTPPPATTGLAARLRGRYCTHRRRLVVHGQPVGEDRWYWMDPEKPFAIHLPVPFGVGVEVVRGRAEFAAAERLFDRLPPDPRAGAELVRHLFGPPGGELLLPAETRGVSGFAGGLILAVGNDGLFVRDESGRWRDAGECPGWFPVVAGGRVYCREGGGIWSRPLMDPAAVWERWCDEPTVGPGERQVGVLVVAGGRLYETVSPHAQYSRPLADRAAGWVRADVRLDHDGLAAAGDTLFGNDGKQLLARPAADPTAAWVPAGSWPAGCRRLAADGDRLLAFGGPGPIYARATSAGPDVPWVVVGRVHDPAGR